MSAFEAEVGVDAPAAVWEGASPGMLGKFQGRIKECAQWPEGAQPRG